MTRYDRRSVATQTIVRKIRKNSNADPRSRSKIMTTREKPQATATGARYFGSGIRTGPSLKVAIPSTSRRSTMYPAKKMASAILANSPGWKLTGPILVQIRAPLIDTPTLGRSGTTSSATPTRPIV